MPTALLDEIRAPQRSKHDIILNPGSHASHTAMLQKAVDTCAAQGGGRIVLRPGQYRSGSIILRNGVCLHLEKDARLVASPNKDDYWHKEGMATSLIFADHAENIGLSGEGTVDGNGRATRRKVEVVPDWVKDKIQWGTWIPAFEHGSAWRPLALIHFTGCRNVHLEGIRVEDSPRWTIHLTGCSKIAIRDLTVRSPANACNGDGIDLDGCVDAVVEDCDIETGDDAICLKSSRTWGLETPCRNITIRRCRAFSTTHGFCIGHDTQDNFENIVVSDLQIGGLGKYPTLTGIGLGSVDGASINGVRISNIHMIDVVAPFQMRLSNEGKVFRGHSPEAAYHRKEEGVRRPPGEMRDILVENVDVRGAIGNSFLSGLPEHPLRNLQFRNIRMHFHGAADSFRVMSDVPELMSEYPRNEMWRFLPSYGFFCRHIDGLKLFDVEVTASRRESRPAFLLKDVSAFSSESFRTIEA